MVKERDAVQKKPGEEKIEMKRQNLLFQSQTDATRVAKKRQLERTCERPDSPSGEMCSDIHVNLGAGDIYQWFF